MTIARTVREALDSRGIAYELEAHAHSETSLQTAAAGHVPDDQLAKAVLLVHDGGYVMAVVPASHHVRLHALEDELGRRLALAPENEVIRLFEDCHPGAVPPLGPEYGLETVLDQALCTLATVWFEAGDHAHLVRVTGSDFRDLLAGSRRGFFSHPD